MPYEKREFRGLPGWSAAGHELKVYAISTREAGRIDPALIDAARAFTERTLPPSADAEGGSEQLGYCIVHQSELGSWLLMHWWAHGDICCGRLALAPPGSARFEPMDRRPLLACVWEQVAMQHERNAWVRHMMTDEPDRAAYRDDRLPDGRY